jgi:hypothetical protein
MKPTMTTSLITSQLDSLPNEILKSIYELLGDFQSVIHLACASRAFHAVYEKNNGRYCQTSSRWRQKGTVRTV